MTLQEQIREDMVDAMKSRETEIVDLLRVVAGEFGRIGKDLTDDQALKVLRKMSENAKELDNLNEVNILEKYLPKMLDESQIEKIVSKIITDNDYSSMRDMGKVMSAIKTLPNASQIDGKISSGIVKSMLS